MQKSSLRWTWTICFASTDCRRLPHVDYHSIVGRGATSATLPTDEERNYLRMDIFMSSPKPTNTVITLDPP